MNPFRFFTESSVVLHTPWRADNLRSLLECVRTVSGSCIFYHFFDALRRRHFTTFEFRNDFARWVAANFEEPRLAEQLAVLDPLEFSSVRDTREALITRLESAVGGSEHTVRVRPGEEFQFRTLKSFVWSAGVEASTPCELADGIEQTSLSSFFFHFIEARLRMERPANDYSMWLADSCGEHGTAAAIARLNPYILPLGELRGEIAAVIRKGCGR